MAALSVMVIQGELLTEGRPARSIDHRLISSFTFTPTNPSEADSQNRFRLAAKLYGSTSFGLFPRELSKPDETCTHQKHGCGRSTDIVIVGLNTAMRIGEIPTMEKAGFP